MQRLSSGIQPLDDILHGGFPRHAIHVITGKPGSGKSILAQQIAFANASDERPALYLTTLSEPRFKLLAFLQEMSFADTERISIDVRYESIVERITNGCESLADVLSDLIREHRPGVIVIDSFKALTDLTADPRAWREAVFAASTVLSAYDCATFWVGEYRGDMVDEKVELAVADGVLELHRAQTGARDYRFLRVAKLRGSGFASGHHLFEITGDGLKVYPRLVASPAAPVPLKRSERVETGLPGLDDTVDAGWRRGTTTLLAGPSGSGKTTIGLQFLAGGVERAEAGLLLNFQENPAQVARALESLGWDPADLIRPGRLTHLYVSPIELHIDAIVGEFLELVDSGNVRRVVIDALGDLYACALDGKRFDDFTYALCEQLNRRGVTTMMILERTEHRLRDEPANISALVDYVVELEIRANDDLERHLRVLKSRGSAHDGRRHRLVLAADEVRVE